MRTIFSQNQSSQVSQCKEIDPAAVEQILHERKYEQEILVIDGQEWDQAKKDSKLLALHRDAVRYHQALEDQGRSL